MRYDLNLLKAFDTLYQERNVSRAAARLHLSQPAMSASLARLRKLFQDPLFTRERYGIAPTEKARQMHPVVVQALTQLDGLVFSQQEFEPATADMTFEIAGNDYFEFLILPKLLNHIAQVAPRMRLNMVSLSQHVSETGVMSGQTHVAFGRISDPPENLVLRHVAEDRFVCLMSAASKPAGQRLTRAAFEQREHIVVRPAGKLTTGLFKILEEKGIQRKVKCVVTHFQFVPGLIRNSMRIATLPKRIAAEFVKTPGLIMEEPPVDLGTFPFHLGWHLRYQHVPAHVWLREQIQQCCALVTGNARQPSR